MSDFIFSSIKGSSFSKRDVDNLLYQTIQKSPTLIGLIQGREFSAGTGINVFNPVSNAVNRATNTTFEWYERILAPKKASLTAIAGTTTTFTVADSSIFKVDDILRLETATGKEITEQVIISAIPNGTTLTVVRNYNGVGTVDLQGSNEVVYLVSPRLEEGSGSVSSENVSPTPIINYTQIFKESARITETAAAVNHYAINDIIADQISQSFLRLLRNIDNQLIYGYKNNSIADKRLTGGMPEFIDKVGGDNIKDANNSQITQAMFDDIFESMINQGSLQKDLAIICNPRQSRKVSALSINGSNPIVYKSYKSDLEEGQSVSRINSSISDGTSGKIIVNNVLPKDKVYIVDTSKVKVKPMRYKPYEEIPNDKDTYEAQITVELGFQIEQGGICHGAIQNLAV